MTNTPFYDLSEDQRAVLTQDQFDTACRTFCMEEGVLKPTPPVLLDESMPEVPTVTRFVIKHQGDYTSDRLSVAFSTAEDAAAFLKLRPSVWSNNWETKIDHEKPLTNASIEPIKLATEQTALEVMETAKRSHKNKEANAKARQEYEKDLRAYESATDTLRADWAAAKDRAHRLLRIRERFAEYVDLAGDESVARKFLEKVYPAPDICAALAIPMEVAK